MTEIRYVCQFRCDGAEHTFVLPRQSPLGISVGERYQPTDIWPIDFLCLQHGHVCRVGREAILLDSVAALAPGLREAYLWEIEYECARENCGQHRTIYTRYSADGMPSDVLGAALNAKVAILCREGHLIALDVSRMNVCRLES
jgi:hypothetical protein